MVTRAAKKQNVAFKIACTGTPVENTLADMWCLFDFVQPGLLGALNDFGQRYRKPIEAKTDEEKARVEELRTRIAPQILRRMKADVATELPKKIVVEDCRKLSLSSTQRNLYAKAIDSFKKRGNPDHPTPFKNHLGLLHYLRLVCTDPRPHGLNVFTPEPTKQYREKRRSWIGCWLSCAKCKRSKKRLSYSASSGRFRDSCSTTLKLSSVSNQTSSMATQALQPVIPPAGKTHQGLSRSSRIRRPHPVPGGSRLWSKHPGGESRGPLHPNLEPRQRRPSH